ncbi:MAG: DNA sulfur modification protein DndB [Thermodesulfovibrionales bacterium]|nr:DNA sulfur modification protein DndB [Thermodesulfovibrionales bacterium]
MSPGFTFSFPAIRGMQAKKEYYVAMCPLKVVSKIFQALENDLPPEYRAQRILNAARIPEITDYIIDNPEDYVFSSLTASVDGDMSFEAYSDSDLGKLEISMGAKFLINDGQHRRAAIEEALKINPELERETISVVFFKDTGLKRSQQMFADLNKHAVNTTKSIGILYDNRDPLSLLSKRVIDSIPLLKHFTDKEADNLSKFSPKIFTLTNIHSSICCILNKKKGDNVSQDEETFVKEYWKSLCNTMYEWKQVQSKTLSAYECRKNYINAHGVALVALGHIGNFIYKNKSDDCIRLIRNLNSIDWSRSNFKDWNGRAITNNGKINKNTTAIKLTCNKIKTLLGIELNDEEMKLEETLVNQSGDKI